MHRPSCQPAAVRHVIEDSVNILIVIASLRADPLYSFAARRSARCGQAQFSAPVRCKHSDCFDRLEYLRSERYRVSCANSPSHVSIQCGGSGHPTLEPQHFRTRSNCSRPTAGPIASIAMGAGAEGPTLTIWTPKHDTRNVHFMLIDFAKLEASELQTGSGSTDIYEFTAMQTPRM